MKKKVILIIVPIIILIILAIVLTILYFTTDMFKSNKDLFWKYFAQNQEITNILENNSKISQIQFQQSNSYTSNGNIDIVLEEGENSFKQLEIATTARHDSNTGRTYADASLMNGDINLFNVSYINSDDIYAIRCDEVFANYVGIRNSGLTELAENYGLDNSNEIPDSIDFSQYLGILDITQEQAQHIQDTYLPIITNSILEEQYTKTEEQITIEGNSYQATVYGLQLTGENIKQIGIDCLNALKTDTETLILISNKLSTLGLGTEYTDITNFTAKIDEIINQLQQMTIEDNATIRVFEANGTTIRTMVEVENKITITFEQVNNTKMLTIDFVQEMNNTNTDINENSNEIIDLSAQQNQEIGSTYTTRIIINKITGESETSNEIQIIPDINTMNSNIRIQYQLSSVENNSFNNSYFISMNNMDENKSDVITIQYSTNTTKADTVEEIEELTNSNTAIANNYSVEEFSTFINSWVNIFSQKLTEKMTILGFQLNTEGME